MGCPYLGFLSKWALAGNMVLYYLIHQCCGIPLSYHLSSLTCQPLAPPHVQVTNGHLLSTPIALPGGPTQPGCPMITHLRVRCPVRFVSIIRYQRLIEVPYP